MGCYICKLLFQPTVCVTYETLFHFYYTWNREKLCDPHFISSILSLYAGKTETLLYELELKYGGEFPTTYDETLYLRYMERRLFNVYAEHTNRLQNEGIGFIFDLTESFRDHLDVLLSKAIARYGADTASIDFPLKPVTKTDIPPFNKELENTQTVEQRNAKEQEQEQTHEQNTKEQEQNTQVQEQNAKEQGTAPGKRNLTIITQPFTMSKDAVSTSPYNESTIDVVTFDDFSTDTSCEWDIIE